MCCLSSLSTRTVVARIVVARDVLVDNDDEVELDAAESMSLFGTELDLLLLEVASCCKLLPFDAI